MKFKLSARVAGSDPETIRRALDQLAARGSVEEAGGECVIAAEMEGTSAKDLNRMLLSALRKVERRTTLRAEWSAEGVTYRFFDYVLKKTIRS